MNRAFEAQKLNVGTLFAQPNFFRIPVYQRPFSWTVDNFDDLISDIKGADRTSEYFLGTIVLHKTADPGDYDVVDGQQRLVSMALLLACLRDQVSNENMKTILQDKLVQRKNLVDGIPEKNRIEVKDGARFNPLVAKEGGTDLPEKLAGDSPSGLRYLAAIETFKEKLSTSSQDDLESIIQFINQKCVLIALSASNFEEAFRLFTIVNDRGRQLRRIDILKAANLDPKYVPHATVRDKLANKWEDLEDSIGETEFESIFSYLRLILLRDKPQKDLYREFEDRVFSEKLVERGEPFFELAFDYANIYRRLFIDEDFVPEDHLDHRAFTSLLFIMNNEFAASEWRAALMAFAKKFGHAKIYDFLLVLEKAFLTDWVKAVRKDERFQTYSKILAIIAKHDNADSVVKSISYDESAIRAAILAPDFYHAAFAKYALLRLELLAAELESVRHFRARSIEHVLPQTPEDDSDWLKVHDRDDMQNYVHKIGNLVLLSKSKNSSAGRRELAAKQATYLKPSVTDYPRSAQVLGYSNWTKDTIEDRTKEAATTFLDRK